jgi:hypothetical protein
MPDIGDLIGRLVGLIGEVLGASSLRLGIGPTFAILGVLLVLLSLVARPTSRWLTRDLGHLAAVARFMSLAAEAGAAAAFSLGTAGVARSAVAAQRVQTLAALPLLGHVARAAARSGAPTEVTSNDPVAALLAETVVRDAHRATDTAERARRSQVRYLGEGRGTAAARALAEEGGHGAAFAMGGMAEESLLLLDGMARGASSTSFGTAQPTEATSVLLEGEGTLIGPQLYQAPADLHAAGHDRVAVFAGNRLIWMSLIVLLAGSLVALLTGGDVAGFLVGH